MTPIHRGTHPHAVHQPILDAALTACSTPVFSHTVLTWPDQIGAALAGAVIAAMGCGDASGACLADCGDGGGTACMRAHAQAPTAALTPATALDPVEPVAAPALALAPALMPASAPG